MATTMEETEDEGREEEEKADDASCYYAGFG